MLFLDKIRWFFLLGLLLLSAPNLAAPLFVGKDIPYQLYIDKDHLLDFEGFRELVKQGDLQTQHKPLSRGYVRPTFWLHWVFPAEHFVNQDQLLLITPNFVDEVTIYYRPLGNPAGEWVKKEAGDITPGIRGDLDYRFPVFKIPQTQAPHLGYEFVVRIKTISTVIFEASLWEPEEFIEYSTQQTGVILALISI